MAFRQYLMVAALAASIAALAASIAAAPAAGQNISESDRFLTAVKDRNPAVAMEVLQTHPAMVNAKGTAGETALLIAVGRRDEEWTPFLLSNGADPNAAARNGDTPLIVASRVGYLAGASELAGRGAKIDASNKMGETALIVAVQQRHLAIVRLLLSAGANPDKTDNAAGYSARDYAKRDPRAREILRLIETRKPKP